MHHVRPDPPPTNGLGLAALWAAHPDPGHGASDALLRVRIRGALPAAICTPSAPPSGPERSLKPKRTSAPAQPSFTVGRLRAKTRQDSPRHRTQTPTDPRRPTRTERNRRTDGTTRRPQDPRSLHPSPRLSHPASPHRPVTHPTRAPADRRSRPDRPRRGPSRLPRVKVVRVDEGEGVRAPHPGGVALVARALDSGSDGGAPSRARRRAPYAGADGR